MELLALQDYVIAFMKVAVKFVESCHVPGMRTQKFHTLDHIVNALRAVGDMEYLLTDLFEDVHQQCKSELGRTSMRINSVIEEAITQMNLNNCG